MTCQCLFSVDKYFKSLLLSIVRRVAVKLSTLDRSNVLALTLSKASPLFQVPV